MGKTEQKASFVTQLVFLQGCQHFNDQMPRRETDNSKVDCKSHTRSPHHPVPILHRHANPSRAKQEETHSIRDPYLSYCLLKERLEILISQRVCFHSAITQEAHVTVLAEPRSRGREMLNMAFEKPWFIEIKLESIEKWCVQQ